jgi:3HB-oligomer hydrolase (3HBOH)
MVKRLAQCIAISAGMWAGSAMAAPTCADVHDFLVGKAVDVVCFPSTDLRTNNPETTPPDNSITTFADGTPLPGPTVLGSAFSYVPTIDRTVISNGPSPTAGPVPGIQVEGWFANDPTNQARFVLRFPDDWNGNLVVAGSSGNRSEHNGDWAWSDYVVSKGYAYASQNKGALNLYFTAFGSVSQPANDSLSCRLNPVSTSWVHYYVNDPQKSFTEWTTYMLATARLAQGAAKASYKHHPRRTYAVGTSNGGYQVRRAIEEAPNLFDGGVDWEGTFIDADGPNLLIDLPPAIKNFPAYVASGYDLSSVAAQNILAAGYPPDIANPGNATDTLWTRNYLSYWEVTACQWQKRLDPTYATYAAGLDNYDYLARSSIPGVFDAVEDIENTGKIKKPLITVAGTMDALLPIKRHARAYEAKVNASRRGNNEQRNAQYRLFEIQNGNHIESYVVTGLPQLVPLQPHAQKAFDVLVAHVENNVPLPPSQCVPKGGDISATPTQPGHCASLFVP